jgi:hypothetical protein
MGKKDNFCVLDCMAIKRVEKQLKEIDRKLSHLLEQQRFGRQIKDDE